MLIIASEKNSGYSTRGTPHAILQLPECSESLSSQSKRAGARCNLKGDQEKDQALSAGLDNDKAVQY